VNAERPPDTDTLVELASQGDEPAKGQLLVRHRKRLRQMVEVRMDPRLRSRLDPSDVVQDTLMEAAAKLHEYLRNRPIPYYPWLRQLAWQRLHDLHIRHVHAKQRSIAREGEGGVLSDASILQLAQRVVASGTSPSTNLFRKELRNTVREALNQLKAEDREVLILRYLEQLDTGEIAAILGISGEAASMRHLRALRRLRELLRDSLGGI